MTGPRPVVAGNLPPSTALFTDRYELTMLDASLASGVAHRRAVFEVFARGLPAGRRYGVFAGLGRLLESIEAFRFGDEELGALEASTNLSDDALELLARYRFSGSIDAYHEGECYFPFSPVLTVESTFAEAVLLETLVLSVLNFDSAVAAAAARMVSAAGGRPLIEMGSRRVHEAAAVAAARAAYLVGFSATSNLEAGRRYAVPTAGTAAHAFVLVHDSEREAFGAQLDVLGMDSTLVVDTFDVDEGIRAAVDAARERGATGPGSIRIDSGDLAVLAGSARRLLDELGAQTTEIVASSDLDEHLLAALGTAPIDRYGVGTKVVTGSGAATAGFVYKLVAVGNGMHGAPLRAVAKRSLEKTSTGGKKRAFRLLDERGFARGERLVPFDDSEPVLLELPSHWSARRLQVRVVEDGRSAPVALGLARQHHERAKEELGVAARSLEPGEPALAVERCGFAAV